MQYRLISNGRLVEGADEAEAVEGLAQLTGVSEKEIREKLLSNKRVKLKSSTDKDEIETLFAEFSILGLDVEVEQASSDKPARKSKKSKKSGKSRSGSSKKRVYAFFLVLLLVLGGAGAYLWNLTRIEYPQVAVTAEDALANGKLVAIAHANVNKLVQLNRLAFGEMDPAVLPIGDANKDIISTLFDGPANLRGSLDQLLLAVYAPEADSSGKTAILLLGDFDKDAVSDAYRRFYKIEKADGKADWYVLHKKVVTNDKSKQCPSTSTAKQKPQQPGYLFVDGSSILHINSLEYGEQLIRRLQTQATAKQSLAKWQDYRNGKLASAMLVSIPDTGKSLGGMQGMMINQAGTKNPEINSLAAGLEADFMSLALNANLSLYSDDRKWKSKTYSSINQSLAKLMNDTRKITPTLASLLSRVQLNNQNDALQINVGLDRSVLDNFGNVIQESMSSFMGMGVSASQKDGPVKEQLQLNPAVYAKNKVFSSLPPLELKSYESEPLFSDGAFAVDFAELKKNDDGLFVIQLQGKVSLPKGEDQTGEGRTGELALFVDSVADDTGTNLLRDEQCTTPNELFGRSPNHEPETTTTLSQDQAQVMKFVRLRPDVKATDIDQIKGYIRFSSPVKVREYSVPLQAGESVEDSGMRFYLSRIGENSVSYQVSGNDEKLLEVRALNKDGKPLRKSWRLGSPDDGRTTQNYQGKVHALKIFVAQKYAVHKSRFKLENLYAPGEKEKDQVRPYYLAPALIPVEAWNEYNKLDMLRLEIDKSNWLTSGKKAPTVAEEHWRGLSMYLTHTPSQWGNSPWAHVYYPLLKRLPGALSALGYQIEEPAAKDGPAEHFVRVHYPYNTKTGEVVARHSLEDKPIAYQSMQLNTGLKDNQRLDKIKGKLVFRLPAKTSSTTLNLFELWDGKSVDGVKVSLASIDRGMFPGYSLKIEGDIEKLVNLHGIDGNGERVIADPINYQQAGFWTMTLPFGQGINTVELVLADKQEVLEYPFDLKARYP